MSTLDRLAREVRGGGGLLAGAVAPASADGAYGAVAAAGSRAAGREDDYAGAVACDTEGYGAWCRALLARGVYPPPSQFEAWFPSLAHAPEHVERTVEAAAAAFGEIA